MWIQGTLIRVFHIPSGNKLRTFRRGARTASIRTLAFGPSTPPPPRTARTSSASSDLPGPSHLTSSAESSSSDTTTPTAPTGAGPRSAEAAAVSPSANPTTFCAPRYLIAAGDQPTVHVFQLDTPPLPSLGPSGTTACTSTAKPWWERSGEAHTEAPVAGGGRRGSMGRDAPVASASTSSSVSESVTTGVFALASSLTAAVRKPYRSL